MLTETFLIVQAMIYFVNTTHAVEKIMDFANVDIMFYKNHSGEDSYLSQYY